MEKKSDLQKVVNLLEEHGYHVFKAEEIMSDWFTEKVNDRRAINLQIAPYREKEKY
jgi:DUF1009 family protein